MKALISSLIAIGVISILLPSCMIYETPQSGYQPEQYGSIIFCDDFGCRDIDNVRYYRDADGALYYWDAGFGAWIGPYGYYRTRGGIFYRGFYPGYHNYYHRGYYHNYGYHGHPGYGHPSHGGHR